MKTIQYPGKGAVNGLKLELFSQDEIEAIDRATRDVLTYYGVQVSDEEGLKLFEEAGCEVNFETKMVKIPDFVMNKALASAPKTFYLYGRDDEHTIEQSWKGRVHYTCFGTGIQVCTYLGDGKYETRDSNDNDLAQIAKLCDWADGISYFSLAVSARDWAGKGAEDVHEMYTSIVNSSKHFHHIDPVGDHVKYYWEMCKAFYGGDEKLARERPIMSMLVCPTSPLELSHNAAQVIIQGARYGIPVNVLSMAMAGGSSSVHLAGTLVTHNAEILSGIILAQLAKPGAPVFYGSSTTIFDLKHGTAPVGAPELGLISASVAKLGQYYGLPVFVAGM
jgi:trimethylamine--corrinoid protein Co-methyltransferase